MTERERILQQVAGNAMEWALILLPLAIYLLIVGLGINRQKHPVVVRGDRNTAGLLLGLSGFLLLGPPSWVAHLFLHQGTLSYWLAYVAYVLVLALLARRLMLRYRGVLVIYNIQPMAFAEVLQEVLTELGVPYTATPGRVALDGGRTVLDIDSVVPLSNVSLHWYGGEHPLREKIEHSLVQALGEVEASDNLSPVLLAFSSFVLFAFIVAATVLYFAPAVLAWLRDMS